jgi:hypothetical protein
MRRPPPNASRRPMKGANSTKSGSLFDPALQTGSTNVAVGRHAEP